MAEIIEADRKTELQTKMAKLRNELSEIEDAERDRENQSLVGKYFRYRNCYSSSDYWWLYSRVTGVRDGCVLTHDFQVTAHGEWECQPKRKHYRQMHGGFEEITKAEFEREWKKFQAKIASIKA